MPARPSRDLMPSELARLEEVRRVGTERADGLAVTLEAAFADDPFLAYLTAGGPPDAALRLWTSALSNAGPGVELLANETSTAAAIWESSERTAARPARAPDDPNPLSLLTELVGAERALMLGGFLHSMHEMRPAEPHWYLAAIGVAPDGQSQGWGARLMAPVLRRCDQDQLPCYLESTNPRNHSFYHRHGFVNIGTLTAPDGPEIVRFLRQPLA